MPTTAPNQETLSPELLIAAYHGSPETFEGFAPCEAGLHFGTLNQAAHVATLKLGKMDPEAFGALEVDSRGWRGKIYHCELLVTNAVRLPDAETPERWAKVIRWAIDRGYDAIIYDNDYEGGEPGQSVCVFAPEQVVSQQRIDTRNEHRGDIAWGRVISQSA